MVYIVSDERIATENFEQGKIYKVDFVDESILYGVCIGIGSDFVMLSGDISGYIFALTMQTASQVSSIDLYTPIEPEPPFSNLLQYQTGVPPFEFTTTDTSLFSWYVKGNLQQTGTPTPAAPIYPTECNISAINCNDNITSISCEPLRKIGDYTDYKSESVEYRAIKKLVLTGEETDINKNISSDTNYLYWLRFPNEQSVLIGAQECVCTHLDYVSSAPSTTIAISTTGTRIIYMNFGSDVMNAQTSGNTVAGLKEYLAAQYAAGTPVTVWYVLATPTSTAAATPDITTDAGENELTVTADLQPSEMQIVYKIADR